ncbi:MAG: HEAT repeat domain-containing protein [Nitrospirota bacterium]
MNCEEARKHFVDYWRGALDEAGDDGSAAAFQGHLAVCEGCRREAADLKQVWATLGTLPDQDPGANMRLRFYDSMRALKQREANRQGGFWQRRHPAFQVAFAAAILAIGVAIGSAITRQSGGVAQLRGEIYNMRQLVTLSLLQQQSAGDRLQGVNWSYRVEQPDTEVLAALLTTVNHDPNVNVRLAAVDALRNFTHSPVARKGLVQALAKQTSPLVQIAVLDELVELRERSATEPIKVLLAGSELNSDVKQRAEWAIRKLQ